jgi:hypothetical protein
MSSTSTSVAPTSTSSGCSGGGIYSFDTANMSGLVCGIAAPPEVFKISSCCIKGSWQVRDGCTQYCGTTDISEFGACCNNIIDSSGNPAAATAYSGFCMNASASGDEEGAGEHLLWYAISEWLMANVTFF